MGIEVWEEGSCESNSRKVTESSSAEALELFGTAITITVSDICRDWNWSEEAVTEAIHFIKCLEFRQIDKLDQKELYGAPRMR